MTYLHHLLENCRRLSGKTAIELLAADGPQTVTYGELEDNVAHALRYLLSLGVQAGDRIALQLPKGLPAIYLHLAVQWLGAISMPLNPAYPVRELAYFLTDAETAVLFADPGRKAELDAMAAKMPFLHRVVYVQDALPHTDTEQPSPTGVLLPDPPGDPDMTALMIYTSGTTGRPKGAMITHANITANIEDLHVAWGWREDDVLLHALPLFHVHGLVVALHGALHAGATAVLLPRFDVAQVWRSLVERQCTVFMAVPTMHRRLLDFSDAGQYDLSHMRLLTSGSDRLPDDLFRKAEIVYGHTLLERYGMTETGMNLSNPLQGERRVGSVGMPLPQVEARIVDQETERPLPDGEVGEVQIRGPHICKGYWRQPEKTRAAFTADGWLRTGDLGLREPDGYYTLKGRSKDLIISGGFNVYPPEVELVLAACPGVAASAVIGCPDDQWGERVTAVIVPTPDHDLDSEQIVAFCQERLAAYKVPKSILFVNEFPRNALGKVQKAVMRNNICAEDPSSSL